MGEGAGCDAGAPPVTPPAGGAPEPPEDAADNPQRQPAPSQKPIDRESTGQEPAEGQPENEILPLEAHPAPGSDHPNLDDFTATDPFWRAHGEALIFDRALSGAPFTVDDL